MRLHWLLAGACVLPAACSPGSHTGQANAPPFAVAPYESLSREAVVAIALREWRLWGQPVDDDLPGSRPAVEPDDKPERQTGLWQRVGEYWWMGLPRDAPESRWTGKHDDRGRLFPAERDGSFPWSAAFISYVMRMAGAGQHFPYAADHASYINAAVEADRSGAPIWIVHAERPEAYAPAPADLICMGRSDASDLRFDDLPAGRFPGHCDIVVDNSVPGQIAVVGGNIGDAVTMKHVPVTAGGRLATPEGVVLDPRYPWMVVLRTAAPGLPPAS